MTKTCEMCGKQYEKSFRNDCCSVSCYKLKLSILHSPPSGWRVCQYCGKKYYYTHGQDNWLSNGKIGRSQSSANSIKFCCYECGKEDRKDKISKSKKFRYGDSRYNNMEKTKATNLEKYGVECSLANPEIIEKRNKTNLEKYGVKYPLQSAKIYSKTIIHNSAVSSKEEMKIYKILCEEFKEVKLHYKSNEYPFHCDFYIPELNLYIEYQGHWTHGKHAFDSANDEDLSILKEWKKQSKTKSQYLNAIDIWTIRDPNKRKIALQNKLNWLEFFTVNEFKNWLKSKGVKNE